jgi:hypothetical protein
MSEQPKPAHVCAEVEVCGLAHLLPRLRGYVFVSGWRFPWLSGEVWLGMLGFALIAFGLYLQAPDKKPECCAGTVVLCPKETQACAAPGSNGKSAATSPSQSSVTSNNDTAPSPRGQVWKGISWLLIVWGGWLLLWRLLRGFVWSRLYKRGRAALINLEIQGNEPLPSQEAFLEAMVSRLSGFDLVQPGPLWAIQGSWGSGKSFLMALLQQRLESRENVAVVYIHIWREQTEHDLHLAVVEAILSHPKILCRCFSAYPNTLILRKLGYAFTRLMPFGMRLNNGSLEALIDPHKALPMIAQGDLEQVVACARHKGLRIVTILDEVDRATVPVAQAAIVLTRRALALPGLAVVLPYVAEQLKNKVFNPLHDFAPDLHQTFMANLEHHYPLPPESREKHEGLSMRMYFEGSQTNLTADGVVEDKTKAERKAAFSWLTHWAIRRALHEEALLRHYWTKLGVEERNRVIEQSEEKYLSLRVNIPRLTAKDIPRAIRFPTVYHSLPGKLREHELDAKRWDAIGRAVKDAPSSVLTAGEMPPPAIRHFEGRLAEIFAQLAHFSEPNEPGIKAELLILWSTTLAWRKAQHLG